MVRFTLAFVTRGVGAALVAATLLLTACGGGSNPVADSSSAPATPTATGGKDASIVVGVDCEEDGVANVTIAYGTGPEIHRLVGKNPTTRAAGGVATVSENFSTDVGFPDSNLAVTTAPTRGTCTTRLTDYVSGNVLGERTTAGLAKLYAVVPSPH